MWHHPKNNTGMFLGSYDYDKAGNRFFELIGVVNGKKVRFKFPSYSQAKKEGWVKL